MRLGLSLLCLALAACSTNKPPEPTAKGTSTGTKVTQTLGANGGTVSSGDGLLSLEFPMGALSADTEIGIEPITNQAPLGVGAAYRLTPDGATFAQPVKVTMKYSEGELLGSSKDALALVFQDAAGHWRRFGESSVNETAHTVTTPTTHFTDYSKVLGWQLRPPTGKVAPSGSIDLVLKYCEPETFHDPNGGDDLSGLVPRCDLEDPELPRLVDVRGWAVNGAPGGTSGDGLVTGSGRTGTYTAPSKEPTTNPVAVSCEIHRNRGKTFAVANVHVGPAGWSGTISWTVSGGKQEMTGDTRYSWASTGGGMMTVRPGMAGIGEVASASSTYSLEYNEATDSMFMQNGCNHHLVQSRKETLSGSSTTGALIFITPNATGGATITLGLPTGMTTGQVELNATDTVTGSGAQCVSPMPTMTTNPSTGDLPSPSMMFEATGSTANRLEGAATHRVDGSPPLDYNISYSLTQ